MTSPSSSAVASRTRPSGLVLLPAVILSHVCSFLSPRELLVTLSRTATATRALLRPACFSAHSIKLNSDDCHALRELNRSSRAALRSFHSRVLSDCRLILCVDYDLAISIPQLLAALDCFPTCTLLRLLETQSLGNLSDPQL